MYEMEILQTLLILQQSLGLLSHAFVFLLGGAGEKYRTNEQIGVVLYNVSGLGYWRTILSLV